MEQIKIEDRKKLSDEVYRLDEVSFTRADLKGDEHHQKNETYFKPDAVAVLLVDHKKQEFIFARQFCSRFF